MCKEADEQQKNDEPVAPIIPEGLPEASKKAENPDDCVKAPVHVCETPEDVNPGRMQAFQDIPPSDVQETTRAM